ncbi:MAG TPA: TolC family protein [Prosthecobacter sp.]|nr:TolC family protein [Prosthecobacter sp.]
MRRLALCLCLISCLSAARGQSFEETLGLQTARIGLQEVIQRVLKKSLDVRIEWLNWAVADEQTRAAWGEFEPAYYLSSSYRESQLPQNALEYVQTGGSIVFLTEPNLFHQQSLLSQTGISGKLPIGTEYKIFVNSGEFRNDINRQRPPAVFYPEYAVASGITFTQPLLRDFGTGVQLAEVRVSRRNRAVADYQWELQLQQVLARVIVDYFDLIFAVENIAVKRDVVAFARTLVLENQKRLGVGVLSAVDVQEAEVAVSVAKEDVINALSFAVERQLNLKNQMLSDLEEGTGLIFLPADALPTTAPAMDRTRLLRNALQRRPDYRAALEEAEKQAIIVKYMRNQLLPRLDLQATFTVNGLSGDYARASERAFERQGYDAQVGFQFTIPLGNRTARANSAAAEHRQQQAILGIARSELKIAMEIDTLIARVKASKAKVESTRESADLAEKLRESEQKRGEQGLARSFDILKAQRELSEARTRHLAAQADYHKAAIQLALAEGTLLDRYGIRVDRGEGPPKAVKGSGKSP